MIGSFSFRMHPRNMPTLVFRIFGHVGTNFALVHVAIIFCVETQMSHYSRKPASLERAMRTRKFCLSASFPVLMTTQALYVSVALPTLMTRKRTGFS